MHVVSDCQEQFNFVLPSVQLACRAEKFVNKLHVDLSLFFCVCLSVNLSVHDRVLRKSRVVKRTTMTMTMTMMTFSTYSHNNLFPTNAVIDNATQRRAIQARNDIFKMQH